MKIAFVAYFFSDSDGVAALRSKSLSRMLELRGNELIYFTKDSGDSKVGQSFLLWSFICSLKLAMQDVEMVYISCGPFWHLPFLWLSCLLRRRPFICDFRDPWSLHFKRFRDLSNQRKLKTDILIMVSEAIEKLIYWLCFRFWVCTPGMKSMYAELFQDSSKIDLVPNGYDFKFDENRIRTDDRAEVVVVCLGRFAYHDRNKAVSVLKRLAFEADKISNVDVVIEFIGADQQTEDVAIEAGLIDRCEFHPHMPYLQAIEMAANADLGLTLIRDERFDLGTKVFDYIGLGLSIYDSLEPNSHARNYFEPFLTKSLSKKDLVGNVELRRKFQRESQFAPYLHYLDQKNNQITSK